MGLRRQQLLAFDRGVRDDLQKLLVRPHVVLMRRDVEIADQDVPVVAARMQRLARLHLVEKFQLVIEFRIERGIGNVAAGRNVEIVQHQRLCELRLFAERHRDVTRIDLVAEGSDIGGLERQFRDDGDAVIALLPVQRDVLIAEPLEALQRKGVVDAFGFLQAQHVRPRRFEEFGDDVDAQAHRIDIPGCQGEPHEGRVLPRSCEDRPARPQLRRLEWAKAHARLPCHLSNVDDGGHAALCPPRQIAQPGGVE